MTVPDLSALAKPPTELVPPSRWAEFCEWARDGGYDESYFNRWDSRSLELQRQFLGEESDGIAAQEDVPPTTEQ